VPGLCRVRAARNFGISSLNRRLNRLPRGNHNVSNLQCLGGVGIMLLLLAFLLVVLFAGLGFALHVLWIVALVLLVLWLVGFAVGRGESSGRHHFYRW
jgi:hypothetical protein